MRRFFLVAGEPSGDLLGAALMRGLRAECPEALFAGVGGPAMAAEGLGSLFPQDDLAVMGLVEVLPRLPVILRRLGETTRACLAFAPDALITIDSPSFGLRVTARVRRAAPGIRTIHYVAPSVWAWRPGRARRMAGTVDHVLALLPFEPPHFTAHGITCDFVGHPVATVPPAPPGAGAGLRASLGIDAAAPLLLALPGSRQGEVSRHMAAFGETIGRVAAARPGLAVIVPTVGGVTDAVAAGAASWPVRPHILDPRGLPAPDAAARKAAAFAAADAALAASGTVTLELAAAGVPMVAVYRTAWLTAQIVRRIVKVETANLVNLVTAGRAVPEFLQEYFTPEAAAAALVPLFVDGPERQRQIAAFAAAMAALGRGGPDPGLRAARSVLAAL
jgi:lipid-A-disaccharide synthase